MPNAFDPKSLTSGGDASMRYLQDTSATRSPGNYIGNGEQADLTGVPADVLSYRVGQFLNSYYMISQQGIVNQTNYPPNVTATTRVTTSSTIYSVSAPWLVVFLFATVVLFGAAVLGNVISRMTITPDILGYASSLIRDSKYIDLPPGSDLLDGIKLSRLLKEQRIQLGAVEHDAYGVEHLAVAVEDEVLRPAKSVPYV